MTRSEYHKIYYTENKERKRAERAEKHRQIASAEPKLCLVCHNPILPEHTRNSRAIVHPSGIKGVRSACQKELQRSQDKKRKKAIRITKVSEKVRVEIPRKRICLGCNESFDSLSVFNRQCPSCAGRPIPKTAHKINRCRTRTTSIMHAALKEGLQG